MREIKLHCIYLIIHQHYVKFAFVIKICYNKINLLYFTQQSTEEINHFFWRGCVKPPEDNFRR